MAFYGSYQLVQSLKGQFPAFSSLVDPWLGCQEMVAVDFTRYNTPGSWLCYIDSGYLPHSARNMVAADNLCRLIALFTSSFEGNSLRWIWCIFNRDWDFGDQSLFIGTFS